MTDEQAGGGAMELVQMGHAVSRVENETMMQVAIQRPRDEDKALEKALKDLERAPEEAASSWYSIPFKDHGRVVYVEGPSIKAAMALARRWGNCSVGARVVDEDATGANVEGVFMDHEGPMRVLRPGRANRFLKLRDGRVIELSPEAFRKETLSAASKAQRNAVLHGMPVWFTNAYIKRAKEIDAGGKLEDKATPAQVAKAVSAFAVYQVTAEQLEAHLELKRESWTKDEVAKLRGLYQAIKDGETTVEATFGAPAPTEEKKPEEPKASKLDTLTASLGGRVDTPGGMAGGPLSQPAREPEQLREQQGAPAPKAVSKEEQETRDLMVSAIRVSRKQCARLVPQPFDDEKYTRLCLTLCGTPENALGGVDVSALDELLTLLQGLAEKNPEASRRLAELVK